MTKTSQLNHFEWQKNLPTLKQKFTLLSKKSSLKTNKEIILELNHDFIKADHVIIRQILQKMSKKQQLQKPHSFQQVESFFELLKQKYLQAEQKYVLMNIDLTKQTSQQNNNNHDEKGQQNTQQQNISPKSNFQVNKIRVQKFIKDQQKYYSIIVNSYLQQSNQSENGIRGSKIHGFLKKLFNQTQHIQVLISGDNYFDQENYQQIIQKVVENYANTIRQISPNEFQSNSFFINQDQILEFLTFFLQDQENKSLIHILYARTKQTRQILHKLYEQKIKNQLNAKPQAEQIGKNQQNNTDSNQQSNTNKSKQGLSVENSRVKSKSNLQNISALQNKNLRNSTLQKSQIDKILPAKKVLTKEQQLQRLIPQIFTFSCKKKIKFNKFTTFDSIQQEGKQMDIQKFINICTQLGITDLFARDFLMDQFKKQAINRITLNNQKFSIIIKRLLEKNNEVFDKLLGVSRLMNRKKNISIQDLKKHNSKYNYQLRPVNGKDIESIQLQLQQKKRLKCQLRKQKQQILLKKRQGYFDKYHNLKAKWQRQNSSNYHDSSMIENTKSTAKFTLLQQQQQIINTKKLQKQNKRVNSQKFNPQSLIYNYGEEDKLWDEYESKIWMKDNNADRSRNSQASINTILNNQKREKQYIQVYRESNNKNNQIKSNRNLQYKFQIADRLYEELNKNRNFLVQNAQVQENAYSNKNKYSQKYPSENKYMQRKNLPNKNSHNQSILEEALSKRIQKGNNVLKKIASSNLKYYI